MATVVTTETAIERDAGSFRDPKGGVFHYQGRVLRTITSEAKDDFRKVVDSGLLSELVKQNKLLPFTDVDVSTLPGVVPEGGEIIEHPRLAHISYPYEWTFSALKAAALLHLDVHIASLEKGITLSDATAYNVQFIGPNPVFIDHLSFRPYTEGEYWSAHRQFCEQFLNPLLLRACCGVAHNSWFRGNLEGIPVEDLARVLPFKSKLSFKVLTHVVLQARFQQGSSNSKAAKSTSRRGLPKSAFAAMLGSLRSWIAKLTPAEKTETTWQNYADDNSYQDDEREAKERFVAGFAGNTKPAVLWDVGCNTGHFSSVALSAGAQYVVGLDFDQGALEAARARALKEKLNFTPQFFDAANPSPDQGWAERERGGLSKRSNADALVALALIHHLAIGRNIPLDQIVTWLVEMAPTGVIEFVPREDAMVQELLMLREDIFPDYTYEYFREKLLEQAEIVKEEVVSAGGRQLVIYKRR